MLDSEGRAVKNVPVTFRVIAGGGAVQGINKAGTPINNIITNTTTPATEYTIKTGDDGIARARLTLGKYTADSPYYVQGTPYWTQAGLNLVSVSASNGVSTIYTDKPFEAYGLPGR